MREINGINSQFPKTSCVTDFKEKLQSIVHSKGWRSGLKVVLIGGGIVFGLSSAYAIQAFAPNLFSATSPSSEGQNLITYSKSSYGDPSINTHSYTPLHSHKLTGAVTPIPEARAQDELKISDFHSPTDNIFDTYDDDSESSVDDSKASVLVQGQSEQKTEKSHTAIEDILLGSERLENILSQEPTVQDQQDWSSATKIVALFFGVGLLAPIFKWVIDITAYVMGIEDKKVLKMQNYDATSLQIAVYNGHLETVKKLISEGALAPEVSAQDIKKRTSLHLAAQYGHLEVVKHLVSKGADILAQDLEGNTACHLAAFKGATDIVAYFAKTNRQILEMQNSVGSTPLHLAAFQGHLETVKQLVSDGSDIYAQNQDKSIPFHIAAYRGDINIVEFFITKDKDILQTQDASGCTALHLAAMTGKTKVVNLLLSRGANPNLINKSGYPAFILALSHGQENLSKSLTTSDNQAWLDHKWINHRFGVNIGVVHEGEEITLEGFTDIITFDSLHKSIVKNKSWLDEAPPSWNENDTKVITEAIAKATYFANFSKDKKTRVVEALKRYYNHQLLILPSGIKDHSITLSFFNDFMVTGNRALKLYSDSPMDTYPKLNVSHLTLYPHLHLRKMKNLSKIDGIITNLIFDPNSNLKNEYLNLGILNDLETGAPHACVEKKKQPGGICSWLAAKLGFQQALLLYLFQKFFKDGNDEKDALEKAIHYSTRMFKSWVGQDREDFLNEYLDNVPDNNPYKAYILGCIYHHLKHKKSPNKELLALISSRCPEAVSITEQVALSNDDLKKYSWEHKTKISQHSDESLNLKSTPVQNTFDSTLIEKEPDNESSLPIVPASRDLMG